MGDCPKRRSAIELVLVYTVTVFVGLISLVTLFFNILIKGPTVVFRIRRRNVRPEVLTKAVYGSHEFIRLQNVRMKLHCVINGPTDKPLMLFIHGFPEFWYSWRHQLKEFSKDYRTVALDLRGYGESDRPCGVHQYILDKIVEDIDQLITALGYKKCILVAHDWGGGVAWSYASVHPDRVEKLIVGNCPHLQALQDALKSSFLHIRKTWYMFFFQPPILPEFLLRADDLKMLDEVFCGKAMGAKRRGAFTPDDIEAYKYTFCDYDDVHGPINYYRAAVRYQSPQVESALKRKVTVPSLLIWGTLDGAVPRETAELTRNHVNDLTIRYIDGASHWVQQDEPEQFNALVRQFLDCDG